MVIYADTHAIVWRMTTDKPTENPPRVYREDVPVQYVVRLSPKADKKPIPRKPRNG